jgi:membrane peptidoglycan carboxypeptidase
MVRPVLGPNEREPDLLTHHEHNGSSPDDFDYDDEYTGEQDRFNEYGPDGDGLDGEPELDENGKPIKPPLTPKQRKKRRWRRIRRVLYVLFGLFVVLPAIGFVIMYMTVTVPTPESVASSQNQAVTYYYVNGDVMGKDVPPNGNRAILREDQIPDVVKHAVYATEDATFETNSGFDVTGILRAVYNQVTGGTGGGSTISQQYIKKATENDAPTLTRKATELVKSFKMNQTYTKGEIITAYLNTIYFGRGAYGIQAASQSFFKKDVGQLTFSEAALLAGLIQQPGRSENTTVATARWNTALDRMVENNYVSKADRDAAQFPTPVPLQDSKDTTGQVNTFIKLAVQSELADAGFDEDKLYTGGYKVYTTIDPAAQKAAEESVAANMKGQTDPDILNSLVAVDPKTGGILAYYGGPTLVPNPAGGPDLRGADHAAQVRNPGSSIKAFDLTAYLKLGKGLADTFDGTNNRTFPGVVKPIRNAGESSSCGPKCTVATAMEISANTVFYDMVYNIVKPKGVANAAKEAGVKMAPDGKAIMGLDNNIAIGGGTTVVTPRDMAGAYATFAAEGIQRDTHFVAKLTNSSDETAFEYQDQGKSAFDPDQAKSKQIADNVTASLEPVIKHSKLTCPKGHECAGKTGTQQYEMQPGDKSSYADDNAQTWMVGYTPSVATAVWVGGDGNKPLHDKSGKPLFGATIAGPTWQDFMDKYLNGKPAEKFGPVNFIGPNPASVTPTPPSTTAPPSTSTTPTTPTTPTTESSTSTEETTTTRGHGPGGPGGTSTPNLPGLGFQPGGGNPGPGGAVNGAKLLPNDPAG